MFNNKKIKAQEIKISQLEYQIETLNRRINGIMQSMSYSCIESEPVVTTNGLKMQDCVIDKQASPGKTEAQFKELLKYLKIEFEDVQPTATISLLKIKKTNGKRNK